MATSKPCGPTHHHACDCREGQFREALEAADKLAEAGRCTATTPREFRDFGPCRRCEMCDALAEYRRVRAAAPRDES